MKIARMSIYNDTQAVAGSVVAQLGAIVCALQSEKSRRDGLFGALLCNRYDAPRHHRNEVLEQIGARRTDRSMRGPWIGGLRWVDRLSLSRVLLILGLVACLSVAASIAGHGPKRSGRGVSAPRTVPVTITWAMAERFGPGYDRNRNGLPDLPNSNEYVNPGGYEVQIVACAKTIGVAAADMSCNWTIDSRDGAIGLRVSGPRPRVRLPQGTYSVTVTVRLADGRTGSARETIRVKDILIVALGDSLATGEGNPEKPAIWEGAGTAPALRGRLDPPTPAVWADGGPDGDQPRVTPAGILPPANVLHARAHRSTHSGPAQFAMRLEAEDPHTSVTFVCLAATGARTDDLFRPDQSDHNQRLGPRANAPGPARRAPCHCGFPVGRRPRRGPRHERFPHL